MATPTTSSNFEDALDPEQLRVVQGIDAQAIQQEYCRVPSDVGQYCGLAADAYVLHARAEAALKDTESDLELHYRANGAPANGGKLTEGWIEASVKSDPRYRRVRDEAIAAAEIKLRIQGVIRALEAKRESLVNLGADLRAERLPPPSIRERY